MYLSMCFHFPGSARGVAVRELTATSGRVLYWPIVALPPTSQTWLLILAYSSAMLPLLEHHGTSASPPSSPFDSGTRLACTVSAPCQRNTALTCSVPQEQHVVHVHQYEAIALLRLWRTHLAYCPYMPFLGLLEGELLSPSKFR